MKEAQQIYQEALHCHKKKFDFEKAKELYLQVISQYPNTEYSNHAAVRIQNLEADILSGIKAPIKKRVKLWFAFWVLYFLSLPFVLSIIYLFVRLGDFSSKVNLSISASILVAWFLFAWVPLWYFEVITENKAWFRIAKYSTILINISILLFLFAVYVQTRISGVMLG